MIEGGISAPFYTLEEAAVVVKEEAVVAVVDKEEEEEGRGLFLPPLHWF